MHIIFETVLILFTKNYQNPCLSELQLAKVDAFFFETQCSCFSHVKHVKQLYDNRAVAVSCDLGLMHDFHQDDIVCFSLVDIQGIPIKSDIHPSTNPSLFLRNMAS